MIPPSGGDLEKLQLRLQEQLEIGEERFERLWRAIDELRAGQAGLARELAESRLRLEAWMSHWRGAWRVIAVLAGALGAGLGWIVEWTRP